MVELEEIISNILTTQSETISKNLVKSINGLRELGWDIKPTKGTIFLWVKVPNGMTSVEFADLMLEKAAVVVPAGIGYGRYGEGYFRIALTQEVDRLKEVIQRMKDAGIRYQ